ncbi:hypothetical protein ACPXB3_00485 [Gordonia sp. DT219]|uniref:hypothetical protein n=1 Tax=Gordonia sp. DT219 TaxID=3416658 RepID=UPI003CE81F26
MTDPRDALEAGAKQWLAELPDDEFAAVVKEVRAPADKASKDDTGAVALNDHKALADIIAQQLGK